MPYSEQQSAVAKLAFARISKTKTIEAKLVAAILAEAGLTDLTLHDNKLTYLASRLNGALQAMRRRKMSDPLIAHLVTDQLVTLFLPGFTEPDFVQAPPAGAGECDRAMSEMQNAQVDLSMAAAELAACREVNGGDPDGGFAGIGGSFGAPLGSDTPVIPDNNNDPCAAKQQAYDEAWDAFEKAVSQMEFACNTGAGMSNPDAGEWIWD